jgi:hypothetical protein
MKKETSFLQLLGYAEKNDGKIKGMGKEYQTRYVS